MVTKEADFTLSFIFTIFLQLSPVNLFSVKILKPFTSEVLLLLESDNFNM